jgi:hypothetical protein
MSFSTIGLSVATLGAATLAFAVAAPASAQEHYGQRHYTHTRSAHSHYAHSPYAHSHYRHTARYRGGRQIVVHPVVAAAPAPAYVAGPVGAVGSVVGGTGHAVESVFVGAGGIVGGVLGGVLGGVSALFGGPGYAYYSAPFAAPFHAAGAVAGEPFHAVSGAMGEPAPAGYVYAAAPAYAY